MPEGVRRSRPYLLHYLRSRISPEGACENDPRDDQVQAPAGGQGRPGIPDHRRTDPTIHRGEQDNVTGVPGINHHEPNVDKCRPARSHNDRSPGSISLFPSLFLIFPKRLPASPTARIRSLRGLGLRRVDGGTQMLRSGDALGLHPRWRPLLRWHEWMGCVDGTTGLTLPAGCSALASLSRPGGQPVGLGHPFDMATSGGTSTGASRPKGGHHKVR